MCVCVVVAVIFDVVFVVEFVLAVMVVVGFGFLDCSMQTKVHSFHKKNHVFKNMT